VPRKVYRNRETDRLRDRGTERQRDRETERQRERHRRVLDLRRQRRSNLSYLMWMSHVSYTWVMSARRDIAKNESCIHSEKAFLHQYRQVLNSFMNGLCLDVSHMHECVMSRFHLWMTRFSMSHQHTRLFNSCINESCLQCLEFIRKVESWIHASQTGYEWIKSQLASRASSSNISRVLHSSGQSRPIMSICFIVGRVSFACRRNFVISSTWPCWLVMSHGLFKMSHVSLKTSHVSSAWATSFMRESCPVCERDVSFIRESWLTEKRLHCIFQGWDISVFNERATSCRS